MNSEINQVKPQNKFIYPLGFCVIFIVDLFFVLRFPKLKLIFSDFFDGEEIPAFTTCIFNHGNFLFFSDISIALILIIIYSIKTYRRFFSTACLIAFIIILIKFIVSFIGVLWPLIFFGDKLGLGA